MLMTFVSTTWIAHSIRSVGSIGIMLCMRAQPGWCSTSSVAVLSVLYLVSGSRTLNVRGRRLQRLATALTAEELTPWLGALRWSVRFVSSSESPG